MSERSDTLQHVSKCCVHAAAQSLKHTYFQLGKPSTHHGAPLNAGIVAVPGSAQRDRGVRGSWKAGEIGAFIVLRV
jgi:hypothetical protein